MNIPQFGFGTYKISQEDAYDAVRSALEIGYRHIDTAQMYGNEAEVGKAIADSGIDRSEIFLTTKLDNPNHEPQAARDSFALSLEKLEVDYVDLFLIHWPMAKTTDYVETWRTLIEFKDDGRAKNIGVSNFQPDHLHAIISQTGMTPAVNQIELHPYLQQHELVEYQDDHALPQSLGRRWHVERFLTIRFLRRSPKKPVPARLRSLSPGTCTRATSCSRSPLIASA